MFKVFFLIFEPGPTWEKIALAKRGFAFITAIHLLPLLIIGTALEAWGLHNHGKWQPRFQIMQTFSRPDIITFESIQFVLLLALVFVTALLIFKIAQTFHDRLTYLQAFTVVAYGYSPVFLFHFLDYAASVNPAVPWLLGIVLTIWTLYQGIPRVMQPDPTHAFGVYLSAMIVVTLTSGLERLLTAMYLLGYMDLQHSWLSRKLTHMFGH